MGKKAALRYADFLHAVARERGFQSWPKLKIAVEADGLDLAEAREKLARSLYFGSQIWVERLLKAFPEVAQGQFGLACALYDVSAVEEILSRKRALAVAPQGVRRPLLHVCFSKYHQMAPEKAEDAVTVAQLLLDAGADVDDGFAAEPGAEHQLSALYGASGHACHM